MSSSERDARLVLQGVLLTLAAVFCVLLAGCMFIRAQGHASLSAWTFGTLVLCFLGTVAGARRWAVPEQRKVLRWTMNSLVGLLLLAAAGSLLVWCLR